MEGYAGRILWVNLSSGQIWTEPLDRSWAQAFVGGSGLAARYLWSMVDGRTDPLGPENPLIWMTGQLTGTRLPSSSRSAFCARSPLTGIWGESSVGGFVGAALRSAGYDGVVVTGRAARPTYLVIDGDRVTLRDAGPFWGLDTYQTQQGIAEAEGGRVRVACIGPAGEHLVRYAAIMTGDARAAGRTGMGAVMGAKGLKAIAVHHASGGPELADKARFGQAARRALSAVREDFAVELMKQMGTGSGTEFFDMLGSVPARYWTLGQYEGTANLNGAVLLETLRTGSAGCWGCSVQCGPRVAFPAGPYEIKDLPDLSRPGEIAGPEYETMLSFGSQMLIDDLKPVSYLGYLCDALGMDTISAGAALGFAIYLSEQGQLGPDQTDGLVLRWGDEAMAAELLRLTAQRQGVGDLLAEGTRAMERRLGLPGLAVQVNGLEPAMHDPRGVSGMALVYLTSPRGACHNKGDFYMVAAGHSFPEIGVTETELHGCDGVAQAVVAHQNWRSYIDSSGSCQFVNSPMAEMLEMSAAATGREMTVELMVQAGERILNLKRLINLRFGLAREHEVLPKLLTVPLAEGATAGFVPDAGRMLVEYYAARGWELSTGRPSAAKLSELGLADV